MNLCHKPRRVSRGKFPGEPTHEVYTMRWTTNIPPIARPVHVENPHDGPTQQHTPRRRWWRALRGWAFPPKLSETHEVYTMQWTTNIPPIADRSGVIPPPTTDSTREEPGR